MTDSFASFFVGFIYNNDSFFVLPCILSLSEPRLEYFTKLKKLVEETYSANSNKKITLMSHSLGCPYTLSFLNQQTQDWKDKYILQWITLNG